MLWKPYARNLSFTLSMLLWATLGPAAQKDRNLTEQFPPGDGKQIVVDAADMDVRLRHADVERVMVEVQLHIGGTGEEKAMRWIENLKFYTALWMNSGYHQ